MNKAKIILSINAMNFEALKRVVESCRKYIHEEFIIILNNSTALQKEIKNSDWLEDKPYIKLNPTPFDKKRFHGSLVKGVVSNMELALRTIFDWQYFIILSNRTEFAQDIDIDILNEHGKNFRFISKDNLDNLSTKVIYHGQPYILDPKSNKKFSIPLKDRVINWQYARLPKAFMEEFWEKPTWGGFHEGFTMNKQTCHYILKYLKNQDKAEIIYEASGVAIEEVFFHTLSINGGGDFMPLHHKADEYLIASVKDFKNGKYIIEKKVVPIKNKKKGLYVRKFSYSNVQNKVNKNPPKTAKKIERENKVKPIKKRRPPPPPPKLKKNN